MNVFCFIYKNIEIYEVSNREFFVAEVLQDCWNILGLSNIFRVYFINAFLLKMLTV